ncbi:MAG: hypothetical protein ABJC63_16020 [Gemmatimonadales bacterium]
MSHLIRSILVIAGASALAALPVQAQSDVIEVVVMNGPHAGKYRQASEVSCIHYKKQQIYAATWTNLDDQINTQFGKATQARNNANEMTTAAVNILNPDDPGAKYGELRIAFGRGKQAIKYSVARAPLKLTIKGEGAEIVSEGKTKDGIQLRVTGRCSKVEVF